ncbi:cytochrome P450 [Nocardia sp. CA-107356]|uniref:cytochrome P450 n=1 Tax=Nocardia sp. CA-107356 TaxID=3239972 RepID=UPI003D8D7CA1
MSSYMGEQSSTMRGRQATEVFAELFGGVVQDPFPLYNELRELGDGIHFVEALQGFMVTRYADVRRIGIDHKTFSSEVFFGLSPGIHNASDPEHLRFIEIASRLFMFSDPPVHTRIRSTFRQAFTPDAVQAWRPMIERATIELLAEFEPGQEIDIMPHLAAAVPVAVIAAILGVPREMWSKFREWSFAYASTFDPLVQSERRDSAIRTSLELFDFLGDLAEQRRVHPADDMITTLVQTETIDGDHLGVSELIAQVALLLIAGNETTTNLIGNGLTLLFGHPDVLAEVTADPALLPSVVEEMLRFDPPLHLTGRRVTRDVVLGEHTLMEGTFVLPCIAAANHDPRAFESPEVFNVSRQNTKHLAFFQGIHFCVGAPLARMEGAVIFKELLRRFPDIGPGSQPAVRRTTNAVSRGWETRPVRL